MKFKRNLPQFFGNKTFMYLTIISAIFNVVAIAVGFSVRPLIGWGLLVLFFVTMILWVISVWEISKGTDRLITNLSSRINRSEQEALVKMPIGILMYDSVNKIQWINPYLQNFVGTQSILGEKIKNINPQLMELIVQSEENDENSLESTISWKGERFDVMVQNDLRVIYLLDITSYSEVEQKYNDEKLVIGQLFIDNYSEIIDLLEDNIRSKVNSYLVSEISDWAASYNMYVRRIESDRFLLIAYQKSLKEVEKDNFNILDVIREHTSKQNYPVSVSMGISYGNGTINELANGAQNNLNLALGRGGDQVVVKKDDEPAKFYGGKTDPLEKRTRVRSRFVTQALNDIIQKADKVFVSGHKMPDMDSMGASLGIKRIAQMNDRDAYIILDDTKLHTDVKRLIDELRQDEELKDKIISPSEAMELATDDSVYVMVDHSKPSITMAEDLYNRLNNRVIIVDHHRRGEEFPENPMLVYIEPYSSSTCELVTEMFEYQPKSDVAISKTDATTMLAGIIVDTKSFLFRAGSRTFSAASYLRSVGADGIEIEKLLKEDISDYLKKSSLISSVEKISDNIGVSTGSNDVIYSSVIAAQAADTLLTLSDIEASYVITRQDEDTVHISARSLGEINVQVIMEQMGGGGHLSNAATSLKNISVEDAKNTLKDLIFAENSTQTES